MQGRGVKGFFPRQRQTGAYHFSLKKKNFSRLQNKNIHTETWKKIVKKQFLMDFNKCTTFFFEFR